MPVVDAHCHIGHGRYKSQGADDLLASMDSCGIDIAVIVPVEEHIAVDNEEGNRLILSTVKAHEDRFFGFATANPWYGRKAVDTVRQHIEGGLKGIKLNPSLQGFLLNDEIVYPLIETAQTYGVPVYFHTGTPIHSLPLQLRDLAVRFPGVNFIMGHTGAHDFNYDIVNASRGMENVYLETSMSISDVVARAIDETGPGKVLFGSNAPRSFQKFEKEKVMSLCRGKDAALSEMILGGNILKLLGGGRA